MELNDSFEVAHPVDAVWGVLTDVERIAPCLPGAQLTGSDGDVHEGLVKVKVGPITSQYKGKASFTERDDAAHRLLMSASGRDTRGAGNASAEITVALEAVTETSTRVSVHTDLTITGKVAQFGRGVLADVSRKLMGQFADNLAELVASDVASERVRGCLRTRKPRQMIPAQSLPMRLRRAGSRSPPLRLRPWICWTWPGLRC